MSHDDDDDDDDDDDNKLAMMMIMMMVFRTSSRGSTLVWVTASTDTRPCGGRGGGRGSPGSRGRGASSRATDMTLAS